MWGWASHSSAAVGTSEPARILFGLSFAVILLYIVPANFIMGQVTPKTVEGTWKNQFLFWHSVRTNWHEGIYERVASVQTESDLQACAFDEARNLLVTGDHSGGVTFWELSTGSKIKSHSEAHTGWCRCIKIKADHIFSCGDCKTIQMWTADGEPVCERRSVFHTDLLRWIDVTDDERRLVTASNDGFVKLVDLQTFQIISEFKDSKVILRQVYFDEQNSRILVGGDHGIKIWDMRTGQMDWDSKLHYRNCWSMRYVELCAGGDSTALFDVRKLPEPSSSSSSRTGPIDLKAMSNFMPIKSTIFGLDMGSRKDRIVLGDDRGAFVIDRSL
jgi:WD40 repeat protein